MDSSIDEVGGDDHPLFGDRASTTNHDEARSRRTEDADAADGYVAGQRSRADGHGGGRRRRRRGGLFPILAILVIALLIVGSYFIVRSVSDRFGAADYAGAGDTPVRIQILPGDSADDVANTLYKAGVVKSTRAFVDAAKKSGRAGEIQPGTYQVHEHSSAAAAMSAILDSANKLVSQVTIPEGFTVAQALAQLATKTGIPVVQLTAAAAQIGNLGLPAGVTATSAEGFLFPATYDFSPGATPVAIVQTLTAKFNAEYTKLGFAAAAVAQGLTPYQALIIASMIESEAKFDEDRAKIARVILNRLAAKIPIGIDAVNRYGVALTGKDPNTTTYTEDSPYNVRTHTGLPPTPISNPGEASMRAAVAPAAGNWIYYVVSDAAGHHLFTASESEWEAAVVKCRTNKWGC